MYRSEARRHLARLALLHSEKTRTKSLLRLMRIHRETSRIVEELLTRHRRELWRLGRRSVIRAAGVALTAGSAGTRWATCRSAHGIAGRSNRGR